jgi:hypothetical protein
MNAGIATVAVAVVMLMLYFWSLYRAGFRTCERCGLLFSGRKCPCWKGK